MTPLVFAPDADPTTPGVVVDANNILPTRRGYQDVPVPVVYGTSDLPDVARHGHMALTDTGVARLFVAGQSAVYELVAGQWVVRLATGITPSAWSYAQFGEVTLFGSNGIRIHQSVPGAGFTAIGGAPRPYSMCMTNTGQVMVVGFTSEIDAAGHDGWWCSALPTAGGFTSWAPSLATQAARDRFLATPGHMVTCLPLGPHVVAFKERSTYLMRYSNVPLIWQTEVVSNEIGCIGAEAAVDIGDEIAFLGADNFYRYNGASFVPIGDAIREWFFARLRFPRSAVRARFDGERVWWFFNYFSGGPSEAVIYHPATGRWGVADLSPSVSAPMILRESAGSEVGSATFSPHLLGCVRDARLAKFTGRSGISTMRFGWYGDDATNSTMTKIWPRFLTKPPNTSAQFISTDDLAAETEQSEMPMYEGAWTGRANRRWHSAQVGVRAPFEIAGITTDARVAGKR